jgi:hypothetical protein
MMRLSRLCSITILLVLTQSSTACAVELWSSAEGESSFHLNTSIVGMGLLSAPSSDSALDQSGASTYLFGEARVEAIYKMNKDMQWDAAYENRFTWNLGSGSSLGISSALPSNSSGPYRLGQAGGVLYQSDKFIDYNELDRASFAYQPKGMNLTIGRQAVGWGRGTIFSAVDIFAPFTPLEINREWRRGVDAVRADIKITDKTSVDLVSAWGPSWDESALGVRLRGYVGPIDAEFLLAKRAGDFMYGITSSASVGDAEVHGELAVFKTPGDVPDSGLFGNPNLIPKALLGVSNNFNVGTGLKVLLEYHYSGFGVNDANTLPSLLTNPDYQNRIQRGDTQILGRQALALQGSYTFNERWNGSLEILQSLIDSSGVIIPSVSWDLTDNMSIQGAIFYAYGLASSMNVPQSQFGAITPTAILKMSFYY